MLNFFWQRGVPEELPETTPVAGSRRWRVLHQRTGAAMVLRGVVAVPGPVPAAFASTQFTRFESLQYSCGVMLK